MRRPTSIILLASVATALLGGCSATGPAGTTGGGPGATAAASVLVGSPVAAPSTARSAAGASAVGASAVSGASPASGEADPCTLVTKAEAEAQAGGTVTVEKGLLPGPPGEGSFCTYTSAMKEELKIQTAVGRGDYDNDRKSSDGFGNHPVDVPGIGDEAWSDRGQLLGSINVITRGHWMRISASLGFGEKPLDALPAIARQAIGRLP